SEFRLSHADHHGRRPEPRWNRRPDPALRGEARRLLRKAESSGHGSTLMRAPLIFVLLGICGSASAAENTEQVERARKYFEAGKQAYGAGLFNGAISAFEEAYQLSPRPQIAFSLAQAY